MAVLIEPEAKTISLNVRDLAAEPGSARIGFEREGWGTFAIGARVHERVLAARVAAHPIYRKEIHVEAVVPVDDWTAIITGRMDGCRMEDSAAHVEEFKTAFPGQDRFGRNAGHERHRRQLLIYCDLWTRLGNRVASAQLVYVDPDTFSEKIIGVEFDPVHQAGQTKAWLSRLLNEWRLRAKERARKAAAAHSLPFPHAAPRAGQPQLIAAIRDSLETGGHLLAEAPTGSGKTAATIYPALQHALCTGRQLMFLTSKTMQQTMAMRALDAMNRDGVFRAVQLRAKEKMCANDRVFCHEDVCAYARNYPAKMERSNLLERLATNTQHPPDVIFNEAKSSEVCPFEVQLELGRRADVIVADYNYVFDPGSALMHLRDDGLRESILVIDEAHNLPDRIRAIFSPELTESNVISALQAAQLEDGGNRWPQAKNKNSRQLDFSLPRMDAPSPGLATLLEQTMTLIRQCADASLASGKDGMAEITVPREAFVTLWEAWKPAFFAYVNWKQSRKVFREDDPIAEFHFALQRFMAVLRILTTGEKDIPAAKPARADGFAPIIERSDGMLRLCVLCLDPAGPAAPIFRQVSSAIFLSATLQPFELFRQTLGLETSRTSQVTLASPFPRENRRVFILPQVRTNFSARDKHMPRIASLIAEIDAAHDGNKLVLLPSYNFLRRMAELMPDISQNVSPGLLRRPVTERLKMQTPDADELERQSLLKALGTPPSGGILLFAVLGGMFAEGVDYPGQLLETVVVVSPGLPQVSFERELLRRHFDECAGNGFERAYLQPGMTRVVQAAGRLIRTETDRGVIALICGRFLEEPYCARLPRDWYQHSPLELISENPARDIRDFFAARRAFQN